jgi:nucleolar GTP-binding protein
MLEKKRRKIQKKVFSKDGRKGESDRQVFVSKPKHLFSGKSTVGKRDFR